MPSLTEQFSDFTPHDWMAIIGSVMKMGGLNDIILTEDYMREVLSDPSTKHLMAQRHSKGLQFRHVSQAEADFFASSNNPQKEIH